MSERRFCPFCSKANRLAPGTAHRHCSTCGQTDWTNPAPAVGIAILREGRILLSRRAHAPKAGEWDLVGGFMEAGETPEAAARREVREETGCSLLDFQLRDTAPGEYGGRPTLNFLAVGKIEGEPKASDDSSELRWFPLHEVPAIAWPHEAEFVARLRAKRK